VAASLAMAGSAGGAVIGAKKLTNSDGASTCISSTCTIAAPKIPGAVTQAPFSGTITRWKVSIPDPHDSFDNDGPMRLQVLKRTANEPGLANDEYVAVRETEYETLVPGLINPFQTSLRIRKGQFIGVSSTSDTEIFERDKAGAHHLNWSDALIPGEPARAAGNIDHGRFNLFNARLVQVTG
jgi:hypothetical protein